MQDGAAIATGKIIFLHGASSAGKSTIAAALQNVIEEPFWRISIDHIRDAGILPTKRIDSGEFQWWDMRGQFFAGYHGSLAAYADAGNNLILEHILDTQGWHADLRTLFDPFDLFFVGVHCSLPELIRRERARGDRPAGSAERDYRTIHRGLLYDLQINSEDPLEINVQTLMSAWRSRSGRSAFYSGGVKSSGAREE